MQTSPAPSRFAASIACRDDRGLGKQRAEALQVLNALEAERTDQRCAGAVMRRGQDDLPRAGAAIAEPVLMVEVLSSRHDQGLKLDGQDASTMGLRRRCPR